MGWRSRVDRFLFGSGEQLAESEPPLADTPAAEAVGSSSAFSQGIIDEDRGWRSLISGGMRELTWAQLIENFNDVTDYYRTNPIAFRLVQLQVEHVLGEGMRLRSVDPKIQAEIDLWWDHPLNQLEVRQFDFMTGLSMDGELFVTRHVNPYDLTSYVRLVPAALIDRIETNPDDLLDELRFHQTAQMMTPDTLMQLPSITQAEGRWWEGGQMRHFAVNRPAGVVRGMSDLAPVLPWLRRYRDWLTDRVRLNKYRTAFVWHVVLKGADKRAVLARQSELAVPPPPGSVIVSNENEEWLAVRPEISADDVQADGHAIRLMIAAGSGIPLFWLAEAEHTARGTAGDMAEPTYRHYRARQLYFGWLMRTLAVDALRVRGLEVSIGDITAEFPELDTSASLAIASSMAQLTDSLSVAVGAGWLTSEDAARVYQHYLGEVASLPDRGRNGNTESRSQSPEGGERRNAGGDGVGRTRGARRPG
jgi:hypothetical protein